MYVFDDEGHRHISCNGVVKMLFLFYLNSKLVHQSCLVEWLPRNTSFSFDTLRGPGHSHTVVSKCPPTFSSTYCYQNASSARRSSSGNKPEPSLSHYVLLRCIAVASDIIFLFSNKAV